MNLNEHHVETMASREISKPNDLICLHKVGVSLPGDRCEQLIDTTTDAAGGRVESERWTITSDWPCLHFHFHSIEFSQKNTLTRFNGQADTSVRHLSATHSTDKWQVSSVSSSAFHCGGASFHYFAISFVLTSDDVSDLNVKNCKKIRTAAHHFLVATPLASRIQIFSELSVRRTCSWHGCMVFLKLKKKKRKIIKKHARH